MSGLTTRTENLKTNIKAYANKGTLIGQMYGTLTGIGWNRWQCDSDRCDLKTLCGYRPAANGYELAGIEMEITEHRRRSVQGYQGRCAETLS